MKKSVFVLIVAIVITTFHLPAFAEEQVHQIEGTFISQFDGTEYIFNSDGTLDFKGDNGIYVVTDDTITIIINGIVDKYTYEFLEDLLILYDSTGRGIAYSKQELEEKVEEKATDDNKESIETPSNPIDFDELSQSVLLLYCYDKNDELSATASGFVAFDSNTIITNYHVIEGICRIEAVNEYGVEIEINKVTNYDIERDVAILIADESPGLTPLTLGDSDSIRKGDEIYTIGSPEGLINTVSSGLLSGEIVMDDQVYLQISAPISSGSSGGVLLNETGQVIGVTSSGYIEGQNLNFAIPINDVKALNKDIREAITLKECIQNESPELLKEPTDDRIILAPDEERVITISIKTLISEADYTFYVYLKRTEDVVGKTKNKDMSFIVQGGEQFKIKVPSGYYRVYYGVGEEWYGVAKKFGKNGHYYKYKDLVGLNDESKTYAISIYNFTSKEMGIESVDLKDFPR